jgi:hypothetical protein
MKPPSYRDRTGREPDFRVRYRFLSQTEGGRSSLPFQHIRSDFLYAEDDPSEDGIWCIWPEFVSQDGSVIPESERVPAEGTADMYVLNTELRSEHKRRIHVGTKGFFVEGARRTASCEVVEVLGLRDVEP